MVVHSTSRRSTKHAGRPRQHRFRLARLGAIAVLGAGLAGGPAPWSPLAAAAGVHVPAAPVGNRAGGAIAGFNLRQPVALRADVAVGLSFVTVWGPSVASVNANVRSSGPDPASGVVVTFTVPDGAALVSGEQTTFTATAASTAPLACDATADHRSLSCAMPTELPASGGLFVSAVVANAGLAAGTTVGVRVEVQAAVADPDPADNVTTLPVTFSGPPVAVDSADLSVAESYRSAPGDDPAVVPLNLALAFHGPAPATDIQISLRAPAGVVLSPRERSTDGQQLSCPLAVPTDELVCTLARYDKGGNIPRSVLVSAINVGLPAGTSIDVQVSVTLRETDPTPADNRLTVPVTFPTGPVPTRPGEATAQLVVTAASPPILDPQPPLDPNGHAVVFGWRVLSSGPAPVEHLQFVVRTGPGLTPQQPFTGLAGADCSFDAATAAFACAANEPLLPGAPYVVTLYAAYEAEPGATLSAELLVATELTDPVPGDNHLLQRVVVPTGTGAPSAPSSPSSTSSSSSTSSQGGSVTTTLGPSGANTALPATGRPTAGPALLAAVLIALGLAVRGSVGRARRRPLR